jgi:hypothetical protein
MMMAIVCDGADDGLCVLMMLVIVCGGADVRRV